MNSNKQLLGTNKTAKILSVSDSTVRRWSDNGTLPCYRVGNYKYRKFDLETVLELKAKYYGDDFIVTNIQETNTSVKMITENIIAESHPAHYLMHKYWGRKPHNVVNKYIKCFTKEGDTVLDPFLGSGVTVIESLKLKRKVIGIDINPMSYFITQNTISQVDLDYFSRVYDSLYNKILKQFSYLYETYCPICGEISYIETAVWEIDTLKRIKGVCPNHGKFIKDADTYDIDKYNFCMSLKKDLLAKGEISYPTDKIMKYVKRSGRERIDELFSDRALIILSYLRNEINTVDISEVRNLLMFCFTSMLSNVSRMLPGDLEKSTYKSGWVISKFWTPKIHTERNVFLCLSLRYKAVLKGKKQLLEIDPSLADISVRDSSDLEQIKNDSVDYILTDPPYGESIAYLALSHFWNSWINNNVDYSNEIIIDRSRGKDYNDYQNKTKTAYKEFYRVLKPDHYMSFTFHSRDLHVWKAILDSCYEADFVLENIILQEQAVSSGTQGINQKNTLTGDFVYNFKKTKCPPKRSLTNISQPEIFIKDKIKYYIKKNDGATASKLYEYIIPIIVQNHAYMNSNNTVINIEGILENNFDYIKVNSDVKTKLGGAYKWVEKNK